jgi:hypothetical protein
MLMVPKWGKSLLSACSQEMYYNFVIFFLPAQRFLTSDIVTKVWLESNLFAHQVLGSFYIVSFSRVHCSTIIPSMLLYFERYTVEHYR